jgi:hypothetical protein
MQAFDKSIIHTVNDRKGELKWSYFYRGVTYLHLSELDSALKDLLT